MLSICYGFVGKVPPYFDPTPGRIAAGVAHADFSGGPLAKRKPHRRRQPSPSGLGVRRTADGRGWALVHPACVRERSEDLGEAQAMIDAGELDLAEDELRWLLADCSEFIAAHVMLGELALAHRNDVALARGHFGAGYQLGLQTLRRAGLPAPLPYSHPANRAFLAAGRGTAWCLAQLGRRELAQEIVNTLVELDPTDPLKLRTMLDDIASGGLPIVELAPDFKNRNNEGPHE
jgi:hypothetical protein